MINNTSFDLTPYIGLHGIALSMKIQLHSDFILIMKLVLSGSWANTGSYEYGSIVLEDSNGWIQIMLFC